MKRELLVALENGEVPGGFAGSGRAMVVLTMDGFGDDQGGRRGRILERWSVEGREADPGEVKYYHRLETS